MGSPRGLLLGLVSSPASNIDTDTRKTLDFDHTSSRKYEGTAMAGDLSALGTEEAKTKAMMEMEGCVRRLETDTRLRDQVDRTNEIITRVDGELDEARKEMNTELLNIQSHTETIKAKMSKLEEMGRRWRREGSGYQEEFRAFHEEIRVNNVTLQQAQKHLMGLARERRARDQRRNMLFMVNMALSISLMAVLWSMS